MKDLRIRLAGGDEVSAGFASMMKDKDWSGQKVAMFILRQYFAKPVEEVKQSAPKQEKESLVWDPVFSPENQKEIKNLRKVAKAPITQRALDTIAKQVKLSIADGFTMDQILDVWTDKGWKSLKAEWVKKQAAPQNYVMTTQAQVMPQKTVSSSQGNSVLAGLRA